jgi:hypothetical protein
MLMASLPPTIYRSAAPAVMIAPFARVTVKAADSTTVDDFVAALTGWTGQGSDHTADWAQFAVQHRLVSHDNKPFCSPDYAYASTHRWVALAVEAPREVHIYVGLCVSDERVPDTPSVAEKVGELISILAARPLARGKTRIKTEVSGAMYNRGALSGRTFRAPRALLPVLLDAETFKEGTPLFIASFGALLSSKPAVEIGWRTYILTLGITLLAYVLLAAIRWRSQEKGSWISVEWPE